MCYNEKRFLANARNYRILCWIRGRSGDLNKFFFNFNTANANRHFFPFSTPQGYVILSVSEGSPASIRIFQVSLFLVVIKKLGCILFIPDIHLLLFKLKSK